jgi:CRP-like cAMP-binding protein
MSVCHSTRTATRSRKRLFRALERSTVNESIERMSARQVLVPSPAVLKQNAILGGLTATMIAEVLKTAKLIALETSEQIYQADRPIRDVYFPIDSVLSVVTQMRDGGSIEVGTVGREGVSAIPLLLGATTSANESYCQVPGRAVVISSDHFRQLLDSGDGHFRGMLDRFLQAYVNMLGQLAACNGMHNIHERCARWLLLTHDRVNSDKIALTHEYLAMMLGARRSGVTIAAATLQQAGFIRYAHGHIVILNRHGLEDASCECYGVARAQFGPLLEHNGRQAVEGSSKDA